MGILKEIREIFRDAHSLLHGNFLVACLGISFFAVTSGVFMDYEGKYIEALGGSYLVIGVYYGVWMLIGATAGIPGGYLCDTYGRKRLMVIGHYLTAIVWFIIAVAPTWEYYFAAQFLLAFAAFWTITETIIVIDSLPIEKRGLGLAIYWTIPGLLSLASPYIGGWVFEIYGVFGMKLALSSMAIADLMTAILCTRFLKETIKGSVEGKRVALSFKDMRSLTVHSFVETFRTLKWMPRSLLALCALNTLYSFVGSLAVPFFIFYATDVILLTFIEWGAISMIERGVNLALRFPGGRLVDRFGKRRAIIANCGIQALAILGFIYCRSYLQVLTLFVLNTAVVALTMTAWQALQADFTPSDKRGKVFSLFRILGAFSGFFGSILGGYMYTLSTALPFWFCSLFGIAAAAFAFLIIKEAEKPEE